ncbi:MAG: hypothetical protein MJY64_03125 [archaeon]|nr:hypothetical protein [archaeon]
MDSLVMFSQVQSMFYPIYTLNYDIDAIFTTSTRRIIHREKFGNVTLCIDGKTGEEFDNAIYEHYYGMPAMDSSKLNGSQLPVPVVTATRLNKIVEKAIISRHSHTITYFGGNKRFYSRFCAPSVRDFSFYNITLVYLPIMSMNLNIKQAFYPISEIYYTQDKLLFSSVLNTCAVCRRRVDRGYICNDCGSIVHQKRFLDSHGFICEQCGKTLCRACTYVTDYRSYVCEYCAKSSDKPYRHVSSSISERGLVGVGIFVLALLMSFIIPASFESRIAAIVIAAIFVILLFLISSYEGQERELDEIDMKA